MNEKAQARLAELQREYEVGQRQLHELMAQEVTLRETLLRISGAIQVLAELTGRTAAERAPATEFPGPGDGVPVEPPGPGTVLTVG